MKLITKNKKAFFDYEIVETIEAGIVLTGDEVKSLRAGKVNLTGTFATVHDGELFMINAHITPYEKAYIKSEEQARRSRKLLVHKRQLKRLIGTIAQKGVTLVPLSIYFNDKNKVKVEIGICKHKKIHGKKETIKERDIARQTRRELKGGY
ncbi:MAG TPA: SsrA-binding protein SmpB [Candidatus Babeliales bacterium]|jgi:SsrA-binding protein|nr:SsrA-binding protein SmpB [Candidatus Babeliales bacterium]